MVIMLCIYTVMLIFPLSFIFINLHDIYQAHLKTQQDYDGFPAKCPSFDFARSHLEKKADIMTPL